MRKFVIVLICLVLMLSGCSTLQKEDLIGIWEVEEAKVLDDSNLLEEYGYTDKVVIPKDNLITSIVFYDDDTCKIITEDITELFGYAIEENIITFSNIEKGTVFADYLEGSYFKNNLKIEYDLSQFLGNNSLANIWSDLGFEEDGSEDYDEPSNEDLYESISEDIDSPSSEDSEDDIDYPSIIFEFKKTEE